MIQFAYTEDVLNFMVGGFKVLGIFLSNVYVDFLVIIGKSGVNLKRIQETSGARIIISNTM